MQWYRMYAEFATDTKVQSMDETLQRRFVMFLCLHCSGEFERLTDEELAFALRVTPDQLAETKRIFTAKGFLDESGKIRNWNKRQYKSDNSTERVQKHREEKKKRTGNVSATPSESDTDTESKIGQTPSAFDRFWESYPKKVKRKTAEEIWRRKRLDPRIDFLLADIGRRLTEDRRWLDGYVPDPTTYLNQERWNDELQPQQPKEASPRGLQFAN